MTATTEIPSITLLTDAYWESCKTALETMSWAHDQLEITTRAGLDQAHETRTETQKAMSAAIAQAKSAQEDMLRLVEAGMRQVTPFVPTWNAASKN